MKKFQYWIKNSGYEMTKRGQFKKGEIEFTIDELAEIFTNQF